VVVPGQVAGRDVDQLGQAELAEDLHAAYVQPPCLGLRRGRRPFLNQGGGDAVGSKEQGRGKADQASADD
jgi:hypothetical protein